MCCIWLHAIQLQHIFHSLFFAVQLLLFVCSHAIFFSFDFPSSICRFVCKTLIFIFYPGNNSWITPNEFLAIVQRSREIDHVSSALPPSASIVRNCLHRWLRGIKNWNNLPVQCNHMLLSAVEQSRPHSRPIHCKSAKER